MSKWENVAQAAQWLDAGKIVHGRRRDGPSAWFYAEPEKICLSPDYEYRLAHRTIDIGGVKVNAPILERPIDPDAKLWVFDWGNDTERRSDTISDLTFQRGRVYSTENDSTAARDAIVRLLTGAE